MRIKTLYFTDKGKALAERLKDGLSGYDVTVVPKGVPLAFVCGDAFVDNEALVFIGAAGIAVRAISPFVSDKLKDPPVIVIDENGNYAYGRWQCYRSSPEVIILSCGSLFSNTRGKKLKGNL